jgi:hypothetical protein
LFNLLLLSHSTILENTNERGCRRPRRLTIYTVLRRCNIRMSTDGALTLVAEAEAEVSEVVLVEQEQQEQQEQEVSRLHVQQLI